MAANELVELNSRWQPVFATLTIPFGVMTVATPNTQRLAIGFSRRAGSPCAVSPRVNDVNQFYFHMDNVDTIWIWWQKYGPIVSLQWNFTNFGAGADQIQVCELIRTSVGQ